MKRILSFFMAIVMLAGMMCAALIGISPVEANAAKITVTSDGTARLYFNMSAVSWWIAGTNGT